MKFVSIGCSQTFTAVSGGTTPPHSGIRKLLVYVSRTSLQPGGGSRRNFFCFRFPREISSCSCRCSDTRLGICTVLARIHVNPNLRISFLYGDLMFVIVFKKLESSSVLRKLLHSKNNEANERSGTVCYITRNFLTSTGHLVLLGQWNVKGYDCPDMNLEWGNIHLEGLFEPCGSYTTVLDLWCVHHILPGRFGFCFRKFQWRCNLLCSCF
jgi:hypothetical protein